MNQLIITLLLLILTSSISSSNKIIGFRRGLIRPLATLLDINLMPIDIESKEKRVITQPFSNKEVEVFDHNSLAYRVKDCGNYISRDSIPQPQRYEARDWLHNLMNLSNSTVLKEIRGVIFAYTIWSILVVVTQKVFHFSVRAKGAGFHSLLGSALGLLLVFRTNSSYSRFWEGRKILDRILNSSRKLSSIFINYHDVIDPAKVDRVLHLIAAFPYVIEQHLKGCMNDQKKTEDALSEILTIQEIERLTKVKNRPLYLISKISKEIAEIEEKKLFTNRERQLMQNYADELFSSTSSAERIVQTPVPLTYARHTSRFLSLYLLSLPVALVTEMGLAVIPFTAFATWSLFGILQIGCMIEDPFSSCLKFDMFSKTVRDDINELLFIHDLKLTNQL